MALQKGNSDSNVDKKKKGKTPTGEGKKSGAITKILTRSCAQQRYWGAWHSGKKGGDSSGREEKGRRKENQECATYGLKARTSKSPVGRSLSVKWSEGPQRGCLARGHLSSHPQGANEGRNQTKKKKKRWGGKNQKKKSYGSLSITVGGGGGGGGGGVHSLLF